MENHEKLKDLLRNSNSLNEEEKGTLIERVPKLSDSEVAEAIETLELENEKWEELRKDDEATLQIFDQYVEESNKEIDREYKKIINNVEKRQAQSESDEADKLLKNI